MTEEINNNENIEFELDFDPFKKEIEEEKIEQNLKEVNEANNFFKNYDKMRNEVMEAKEQKTEENNEDDEENFGKDIIKIQRYEASCFHDYLTEHGVKFGNMKNKSAKQIKDVLHNIRVLVQNKNNVNVTDLIAFVIIEFIENLSVNILNIDIHGLSAICKADTVFNDNLNEFLIENGLSIDVLKNPSYKLLLSFVKNIYIVYAMNKAMVNINTIEHKINNINVADIEKQNIKKIITNSPLSDNEIA